MKVNPLKKVFNYKRHAKKNSYKYGYKRDRDVVVGIILHNTGNVGDSAKNNADYFATGNERSAGAHIFIDRAGLSALSVNLNEVAWSVGDSANGHGVYYNTLNNTNTVSIELCDIVNKPISTEQLDKLIQVIVYIKKKCPNVRYIQRHYDITTKDCPHYYVSNKEKWHELQKTLLQYIK